MLPEGWRETKVGKEYSVQLGKMLNKVAKEKYPQFKYLTNMNIRWGVFSVDNLNSMYFSENERKKFNLSFGDLLVCEGGDVGRCAIWENNLENCFYQKAIHRVRSLHGNLTKYLGYILEYFSFIGKFKDIATRTSIAHLTKEQLENTSILLPPLPEQQKIAAILSTWDKAISTTDALLANSRQQKKALMQQFLTGKRRLPGFTGEWKVVRAGSVLHEEGARNRGSKITRVLSVTNQKGFVLPEEQFSKRVASDNIENYKIIKRGQFGYNPSRLNVGSFGRLDTFEEGILSPLYVIFSVKDEHIDSDFFLAWMHSGETRQRVKGSTQGSVRESVSFNALASFPLNLPPLDEQRAIAAVLDAADREIVLLEQKAAHLREEKKALMQQLLTGKRRVRL